MTDRLHGLRLPDTTACGREGRLLELANGAKVIVQGDRAHRIAPSFEVIDCRQCLERIARHGLSFAWVDVPAHEASVAAAKRRRNRRRSHHV